MSNNRNNNSDITASAIDSAGFDIMRESLIPTKIINPVTPSISSISNRILSTSAETSTKEHDNSSNCAHKDENAAYSNADSDLHVGNSSDFMGSAKK